MKKIVSLLIAMCLIIALYPMNALANDTNELTQLIVGGITVDLTGDNADSGDHWSYANGVLTLDNCTINNMIEISNIYAQGDLVITIVGDNNLGRSSECLNLPVIYVDGNLTINGSGTLNAAKEPGIATEGNGDCIQVYGNFTIDSGASVTAKISNAYDYIKSVACQGITSIKNGSTLNCENATLAESSIYVDGIYSNGIIVESATLNVYVNSNGVYECYGINSTGEFSVNKGKVTSTVTGEGENSIGIYHDGNLSITGGSSVNVVADGSDSIGINVYGNITVDESTLYGKASKFGIQIIGQNIELPTVTAVENESESNEVTGYEQGNLNINITNPKYKVEGIATNTNQNKEDVTVEENTLATQEQPNLSMAIAAANISYNDKASILTPENGKLGEYTLNYTVWRTVFAPNEEVPSLHAVIGIKAIETPTETPTTPTVNTVDQRQPVVAAQNTTVTPQKTSDNSNGMMYLMLMLIPLTSLGYMGLAKRRKEE